MVQRLRPLDKSAFGLLAAVVVGLVALVGVGSRSMTVAQPGRVVASPALPVVFDTTLALLLVLALAILAIIVYAVWPQGRSKNNEQTEWVFRDIDAKRNATEYLHLGPMLVEPVDEVGK